MSCLSISSASAVNSQISQMVLLQDEQSTKALITLSQKANYKAFLLQNPNRAVIDIDAADLGQDFKLPNSNGVILSVRQGKTPTGIRLVLDLAQGSGLSYSMDDSSIGAPRIVVVLKHLTDSRAQNILSGEPSIPGVTTATTENPANTTLLQATAADIKTVKAVTAMQTLPPRSTGNALLDDEIVQIDIDSSGNNSKTTVQKPGVQPAVAAPIATPNPKKTMPPPPTAATNPGKKIKTVDDVLGTSARQLIIAIDAGHGGKDPGALGGNGLREKEVTLRVAKELTAIINADPGMKAVLIRDDDTFVPLAERYQRARRARADLFVSIHADAAENNAASGSSVYVLSTKGASSQAARWLADKENAADLIGEGGIRVSLDDKDRNLSFTLLDLSQSNTMRVSEDAAGNVLQSLKDLGKAHKKEVEHANFVVLRSPDVPSMLIETGFITNAAEERKLADPEHRKRLAFAIAQGLRNFFIEQPIPGTYYAKKSKGQGAGISAGSGIIP